VLQEHIENLLVTLRNPGKIEKKESDATSVHVVPSHWLHGKHIPQIGFLRTPYVFGSTFGCDHYTSDGINSY